MLTAATLETCAHRGGTGLTEAQASQAAAGVAGVSLCLLPPNAVVTAEGVFGRVNTVVIDGQVVAAHVG